jgi:hypothetical protein
MKKTLVCIAVMFFVLTMNGIAQIQPNRDYFPGKWVGIAKGAPTGDLQIVVSLERKDGSLDGMVKIGDQDEVKIDKVEEKDAGVTLYFVSTHGYDVNLDMGKKDEYHVEGTINNAMFSGIEFSAERMADDNKREN